MYTGTSYADGIPGGNVSDPVVRAVDIAKPAVVRIITAVQARLTVNFPQGSSVIFPQSGDSYSLELSGTGTFISAHGDILTADHVVNPPHDQEISQYLDQLASPDVAAYINQHSQPGSSQITKDQVTQALEDGQLPSTPQYGSTQSAAFFSTAYTGPLSATSFNNLPQQDYAKIDNIEKQSAVDQKDVAIVHVPLNDTASVQLGDSSSVQQQDNLTIIGFPGNGDVGSSPTDLLTSSINKVIVSSIKTTDSGATVIQVGGNVEQGDSGGPALDSSGNVVGIVSFGTANPNSPGSTSFLQTSNSARDLVQALNLDTTPGTFQKLWSKAFTDYAASTPGHWHKAQIEFQQLQTSYPQYKAIAPYLQYAQEQAQHESVPSTNPTTTAHPFPSIPALAWTIGALTLIALLALIIIGLGMGRRGKQGTPAIANSAQPYQMQPAMGVTPSPASQAQQWQTTSTNTATTANVPNASPSAPTYGNGMTAFGGPPRSEYISPYPSAGPYGPLPPGASPNPYTPAPASANQPLAPADSGILRPWPCGHMNRSNARFCSICGEPAPQPPAPPTIIRNIEQ